MPEPIKLDVQLTDPVEVATVPPESPPAPTIPPVATAAPQEPPPYDEKRLEKDIAFYQRTGADKVVLEKLGAVSRSEFENLKIEATVDKAMARYGFQPGSETLLQAATVEDVWKRAEALYAQLQAIGAAHQPPQPPEIKLPERVYTPQEAQTARLEYDLQHDPEILKLKREAAGR